MKIILLGVTWITAMVFSLEGISCYSAEISGKAPMRATEVSNNISNSAQDTLPHNNLLNTEKGDLEEKYYVVIGVFALKSNAIKFSQYANNQGFLANFSLNPTNNLYYVYLHSSSEFEEVKKEREKIIEKTTLFPGVWVFNYKKKSIEQPTVLSEAPKNDTLKTQLAISETGAIPKNVANGVQIPKPSVRIEKDTDDFFLYPNVIYSKNYKEIMAKVEIVDPVRSKLMKVIDAHKLTTLRDPNNGTHAIQLIADAFGYRKVQYDISLTSLEEDSISSYVFLRGDTILVEFPMERLKTGDIITMYNVFFKNDAAVMESSSIYELNSLLEMLKENPDYHILIHGHTNGNKSGKIIKLKEESPDFFVITDENKRGYGSAKRLSQERALTIKRYLVENGISEDRMGVKGWGGKKMIYDKNSRDAKKNVRVEIEILQD